MAKELNISVGKIEYLSHNVDELLAPIIKPNEADAWVHIKVDLDHKEKDGHYITVLVEQGIVKKNTNHKVLTIESKAQFKVTPYDYEFFKKPANTVAIKMVTDIVEKCTDFNKGMFVIIREDYGLNEALPAPIPKGKLKDLIYNDVNKQFLN